MAAVRGKPIYLNGNDDEPEKEIARRNQDTGAEEALSGVTGLTFRFSATENGAAINAALQKNATQRASAPKFWYCVIEGADITTYLTAFVGQDVYEVLSNGTDVTFNTIRRVQGSRP